jgi:hypothetical protein
MHDLIDAHRANIAKAGLALAEAIDEATTVYTLAVASSEAELEVRMDQRFALLRGEAAPTEQCDPDHKDHWDLKRSPADPPTGNDPPQSPEKDSA